MNKIVTLSIFLSINIYSFGQIIDVDNLMDYTPFGTQKELAIKMGVKKIISTSFQSNGDSLPANIHTTTFNINGRVSKLEYISRAYYEKKEYFYNKNNILIEYILSRNSKNINFTNANLSPLFKENSLHVTVSKFLYDTSGRKKMIVNNFNEKETYKYEDNKVIITFTDSLGRLKKKITKGKFKKIDIRYDSLEIEIWRKKIVLKPKKKLLYLKEFSLGELFNKRLFFLDTAMKIKKQLITFGCNSVNPNKREEIYQYNDKGYLIKRTEKDLLSNKSFVQTYYYDENNLLNKILTVPEKGYPHPIQSKIINFTYEYFE